MSPPIVSLLTDFGLRDPYAAICKGVILSIAPDAQVIDISHEVRKYAVREGVLVLWSALPYLPVGIHVAVVDPGVGTERRPIAVRVVRGDVLIGPDNGLLVAPAERLGGIVEARLIEAPEYRLPNVSSSFHGRDLFAPAAAHLARGVPFEALGRTLPVEELVYMAIPPARIRENELETEVVYVDTFGNVKFGALAGDAAAAFGRLQPGDPFVVTIRRDGQRQADEEMTTWQTTFGNVARGASLLYEDSYGRLCLADNQGNAAARLDLTEDRRITIHRP